MISIHFDSIDPTKIEYDVCSDWVTPTDLRPLFQDDPASVWLELHGAAYGFYPQRPEYGLMRIIEKKGHKFEAAWIAHMAPEAPQVCIHTGEARMRERFQQTLLLMQQRTPVIVQPVLWLPEDRLYGIPDVLVLIGWVRVNLPALAENLVQDDDQYMVIDLKFTSGLDKKTGDLVYYTAQMRFYSYMLGSIQGVMPHYAAIVTRDRLFRPLPIPLNLSEAGGLDAELRQQFARYQMIASVGADLRPWEYTEIAPKYSISDERWAAARQSMMLRIPGGSVERMWYIGTKAAQILHAAGITSLEQLLHADPALLPKGAFKRPQAMHAILTANRNGTYLPPGATLPGTHAIELFVDCEFFSNINVDFEREWPDLHGTPMIFMIGAGWYEGGTWQYRDFVASAETHAAERTMLEAYSQFIDQLTDNGRKDYIVYHWSNADQTQMHASAERHLLSSTHRLRMLPWYDLEKHCTQHCCAIAGCWSYKLKEMTHALAAHDAYYEPPWPSNLEDGASAQVMGWYAYQCTRPLESEEMQTLRSYLEADCKALDLIIHWLRS